MKKLKFSVRIQAILGDGLPHLTMEARASTNFEANGTGIFEELLSRLRIFFTAVDS